MKNSVKSISEVYATDVEEFFYEEGGDALSEHELVGYDVEFDDRVEFVLQEGVYWKPQ